MSLHSFTLSDMKEIRRKIGCNFTSLVLSCIGGVTRKLFLETSTEEQLPEYICIQTLLPWPNHPPVEMCNHLYEKSQITLNIDILCVLMISS